MKPIIFATIAATVLFQPAAAYEARVELCPAGSSPVIEKEIYGQFAEHLGTCIYGGLWVGHDSEIPNVDGYRADVLAALRELHVPVLRWPGGCFADEYHWMDGIGLPDKRVPMVNSNWGGTLEDNSFGTNEFFNLCELLGCEPYLSGNVGSGTVAELAKWVEYITAWEGPMAELRKANGRERPWRLKYIGVGNESWGCGGNFTPDYYADVYRRYQTYCRNFGDNRLYKIASGASDSDYNWTEVMMAKAAQLMNGLSLHYYTCMSWTDSKGSAIDFDRALWYDVLAKAIAIEPVIARHCEIMDRFDPERNVGLIIDEWGTWFDQEPGTIPGHLFQQNSLRDAMVASLSLNIFHKFAARVKMANIAQIANVLQAMVLTRGKEMVLTPTYYLFKMYAPHQGGHLVDLNIASPQLSASSGSSIPALSATASVSGNALTLSLTNVDLDSSATVEVDFGMTKAGKIQAQILTASQMNDYNDFGAPEKVTLRPFSLYKVKNGRLIVEMPAKSIVTLRIFS